MTNIGFDVDLGAQRLAAGEVLHADPSDYTLLVRLQDEEVLRCDVLQTSAAAPLLPSYGDRVLVVCAPGGQQHGVVLGRIGVAAAAPTADVGVAETSRAARDEEAPDEIVLEAKHSLTLRVGEGSITIREDGRILIKGKDLVSHAQRVNRIKGGAVSIN